MFCDTITILTLDGSGSNFTITDVIPVYKNSDTEICAMSSVPKLELTTCCDTYSLDVARQFPLRCQWSVVVIAGLLPITCTCPLPVTRVSDTVYSTTELSRLRTPGDSDPPLLRQKNFFPVTVILITVSTL